MLWWSGAYSGRVWHIREGEPDKYNEGRPILYGGWLATVKVALCGARPGRWHSSTMTVDTPPGYGARCASCVKKAGL